MVMQDGEIKIRGRRGEIAHVLPAQVIGQILERLAQGMVPKEVGYDLGISYETVRDYLKAVYAKLHVRSRTEAVIKYLEHQG